MFRRSLIKSSWCKLRERAIHKSANTGKTDVEVANIRNIGILAHIDAGKTTTTERMLYYSGIIGAMGEVHDGNTVTDYMDQERQRGITITSASVTFNWKGHRFNLIDTPGHIDFTMGVEQSLNVLDGVVIVLDGSAGVEAQTLTVWRQADKYNIPRIVYVNKMDRSDADFETNLRSMESKLEITTLPVQIPIREKGTLTGIVDVLTLEKLAFDKKCQGKIMSRVKLSEREDGEMWEAANEQRRQLTDKLSSVDDKLADIVIEQESLDEIPSQALAESLRRTTINRKGVPILLGSSYKNIGVQPLMDGIVLYLPDPERNSANYRCFENSLSARAFKIVHDKQKGPVTFIRVFSGTFEKGQKVYNIRQEKMEQSGKLYVAYADDYEEIERVGRGNIAAVTGLKSSITGDLLTKNASAAARAKKNLEGEKGANASENAKDFFAVGARVPDPVFFCSIEPPSMAYQLALETALDELKREDPSLRVSQNEETGQTVLAGMGELHLDIIKERIRTEYKIDADLGPLQIAYKETAFNDVKDTHVMHHKIGTTNHNVTVTMSLVPNYGKNELLLLDRTKENASNIAAIHPRVMQAVKRGVQVAFNVGPILGCPVINVGVMLHWLEVGRGTSDTMVSSAITQCIRKMLENGDNALLEPIMQLEIVTPESYAAGVLADLSKRRANIKRIVMRGKNKVFETLTPLSELLGYSTALRIITSGNATFTLEFSHYQAMGPLDEQEAIKKVSGI